VFLGIMIMASTQIISNQLSANLYSSPPPESAPLASIKPCKNAIFRERVWKTYSKIHPYWHAFLVVIPHPT